MNPAPPVTTARTALSYGPVFVTFEGLDGSGKTTQVELLRATLEEEGRQVVATREPGGTPLGERVRAILLGGIEISPWAEAALFAAARAELVERVIAPELERGADVICDRYIDSSLAYQGIARRLGVERVLELNLHATRGLLPDRTFLLLLDPERASTRLDDEPDRIELEGEGFRAAVDAAYRTLAEMFPRRVIPVDASGKPEEIATFIREQLRDLS
jgi:dTMP kinase